MVPSVLVLTVFVFAMVRLVPGDVVDILAEAGGRGEVISQDVKDEIRHSLGLDRPVYIQYFVWVGRVLRGDLGESLFTNTKVIDSIKKRLPVTLELVAFTLVLLVAWGLSVGILSAIHQDSAGWANRREQWRKKSARQPRPSGPEGNCD